MNNKRGRPRKSSQDSGSEGRTYWLGEVFIDHGWAWSTKLVKTDLIKAPECAVRQGFFGGNSLTWVATNSKGGQA